MFAIKLSNGSVALRLDTMPVRDEVIVESRGLDRRPSETERYDWDADAIVSLSPEEVENSLLAEVGEQRDRIAERMIAENGERSPDYALSIMEAYDDTGPWPFLRLRAATRGVSLDDERYSVMEQRDAAEAERLALTDIVSAGEAAIRSAPTVAGKLAAFQSIPWPQGA